MSIINSKNKCFTLFIRVNILCNLSKYRFIKALCYNLTVEVFYFKFQVIFQLITIDNRICYRVINRSCTPSFKYNTFFTKLCFYQMWCIMVYQISIYYCCTVIIRIYRLTKNLCCMKGWCCSKSNFNSIKIINNCSVLTAEVILITIKGFILTHFFIQHISTVSFIHNDAIVIRYTHSGVGFIVENTFYQALNRSNMHTSILLKFLFSKVFDIIQFI